MSQAIGVLLSMLKEATCVQGVWAPEDDMTNQSLLSEKLAFELDKGRGW